MAEFIDGGPTRPSRLIYDSEDEDQSSTSALPVIAWAHTDNQNSSTSLAGSQKLPLIVAVGLGAAAAIRSVITDGLLSIGVVSATSVSSPSKVLAHVWRPQTATAMMYCELLNQTPAEAAYRVVSMLFDTLQPSELTILTARNSALHLSKPSNSEAFLRAVHSNPSASSSDSRTTLLEPGTIIDGTAAAFVERGRALRVPTSLYVGFYDRGFAAQAASLFEGIPQLKSTLLRNAPPLTVAQVDIAMRHLELANPDVALGDRTPPESLYM